MKLKNSLVMSFLVAYLTIVLVACGGKESTASDLPVYPDAILLQAGDDPLADTLIQNAEQDANLRSSLGVGGSIEQVAYKLPAGTSWEEVKAFYGSELEDDGWKSGMGGPGGDLASNMLESVNASNEFLQTGSWNKGNQIITVVRNVGAIDGGEVYLIVSLNSN